METEKKRRGRPKKVVEEIENTIKAEVENSVKEEITENKIEEKIENRKIEIENGEEVVLKNETLAQSTNKKEKITFGEVKDKTGKITFNSKNNYEEKRELTEEEILINEVLGMKITSLKKLAKEYEVENFSVMTKSDLVNEILVQKGNDKGKIYGFGKLDIMTDGYGFLRNSSVGPDVYISISQIKRFFLRKGDIVFGELRIPVGTEKNYGLLKVMLVNGDLPEKSRDRPFFDDLIPSYPEEKIKLGEGSESSRIIDLISPIGKGQRGLIVAPPKAGKTTLLSTLANDIIKYNPEIDVWILLIDERPEEVTDIRENVKDAEVYAATFDEDPRVHTQVTENVLEMAKREVEKGKDILILMDSLTRLARSYNITIPSSGKLISGGIDPNALYYPKRFLGAARNIKKGGSLTIIATALVETGSKMDEVIFEEFKGTGNMEIILNRTLEQLRIFPAIDILKSGTRKEELLIPKNQLEKIWKLRRELGDETESDAIRELKKLIKTYGNNDKLLENIY